MYKRFIGEIAWETEGMELEGGWGSLQTTIQAHEGRTEDWKLRDSDCARVVRKYLGDC